MLDQDKNGILDTIEVASVMSLICNGSVIQKLKNVFAAFGTGKEKPSLNYTQMKQFFLCIFKFSLHTSKEVLFLLIT